MPALPVMGIGIQRAVKIQMDHEKYAPERCKIVPKMAYLKN